MAVNLSWGEKWSLLKYIYEKRNYPHLDRFYHKKRQRLLGALNTRGIDINRLEDIPVGVGFNPAFLKFPDIYFVYRVELAYSLQDDLKTKGRNVEIRTCYRGIDRLVNESYDGKAGKEHKTAVAVVEKVKSYMANQERSPSLSERLRLEHTPLFELGCLAFLIGEVGELSWEYFSSHTQSEVLPIVGALVCTAVSVAAGAYIDALVNYDFISWVKKKVGIDPPNAPSYRQRKFDSNRELYDRLCTIVSS